MDLKRNADGTYLIIPNPGFKFIVIAAAMYDEKRNVIALDAGDRVGTSDKPKVYHALADFLSERAEQLAEEVIEDEHGD